MADEQAPTQGAPAPEGGEKKPVKSPDFGPPPPKVNRDDPLPPGPPSLWPDPEKRAEIVKQLKEEKRKAEDAAESGGSESSGSASPSSGSSSPPSGS